MGRKKTNRQDHEADFVWSQDDRWTDGKGKMIAEIVAVTMDLQSPHAWTVKMRRWSAGGSRKTTFTLTLAFFLSSDCGWKKVVQ